MILLNAIFTLTTGIFFLAMIVLIGACPDLHAATNIRGQNETGDDEVLILVCVPRFRVDLPENSVSLVDMLQTIRLDYSLWYAHTRDHLHERNQRVHLTFTTSSIKVYVGLWWAIGGYFKCSQNEDFAQWLRR